ncbi:amidohydrolase family protein [Amycolatopsis nigrescens]|uniref:amidohydrolase family protein n=1 Tax=Amycolatopsis nigrescens TaxID=381445 RepID=UPI0003A1F57A|nr:amidohydrolase family protein [Amycolatopsis nigrescens]
MSDTARSNNASTRRDFLAWLAKSGTGLAVATGALSALSAGTAEAGESEITVLDGATVIDGTGGRPRRGVVVLSGDRILAVGPAARGELPAGVRVIDVRGKYVIPGLWDTHVHTLPMDRVYPPLYVVNGVTGIREMYGYGHPSLPELRDRINAGTVLGPRMVIASTIVDGPHSIHGPTGAAVVATEAEARAAVRAAKQQGADFVKVYSFLGQDTFTAIADEAGLVGLPFAGHVPDRVSAGVASDAGQRSFEHLFGLFFATSRREDELRQRLVETPVDPANPFAWYATARALEREAVRTHSPGRAAELFDRLRRNGTWASPTLTVLEALSLPFSAFDPADPRLRYLPPFMKDVWLDQLSRTAPSTPESIEEQRRFFEAELRLTGALHRAGVGVLAGTDTNNPYCFPGFSLHDELALLVRAGLSPMRVLRAATADAARYLGLEHTVGTVTPGMAADLVVLDADPLADIRNTRRIHAVVSRGKVIDAARRQELFADIEAAAGEVPPFPGAKVAGCGCRG